MHRQIGILLKKLASGVARSIQKGLCVTVSMDYRELTTQSIILSFYTLRLPCKSGDEILLASICGSRNEDVGKSSKAAHSDMKPQNTVPQSQAFR